MNAETLEKEIVMRVKRIKCDQKNCKSSRAQTQEIVVFGTEATTKKGLMCTSCYIDNQLLANLVNPQHHSMSVQKFMKVLTKQYHSYALMKKQQGWAPNIMQEQCKRIKKKVTNLSKQVQMGIMQVMKYLDDIIKKAFERVKETQHDKNFEKILFLIQQENQDEQERINVNSEIKEISVKIVKNQGNYTISTDEQIKSEIEKIIVQCRQKILKGKQTILKLTQILKKCIKYLVE